MLPEQRKRLIAGCANDVDQVEGRLLADRMPNSDRQASAIRSIAQPCVVVRRPSRYFDSGIASSSCARAVHSPLPSSSAAWSAAMRVVTRAGRRPYRDGIDQVGIGVLLAANVEHCFSGFSCGPSRLSPTPSSPHSRVRAESPRADELAARLAELTFGREIAQRVYPPARTSAGLENFGTHARDRKTPRRDQPRNAPADDRDRAGIACKRRGLF